MKLTIYTLLLSITLFSCSEYSDADYELLQEQFEARKLLDADRIASFGRMYADMKARYSALSIEHAELKWEMEDTLEQYNANIAFLQEYYEAFTYDFRGSQAEYDFMVASLTDLLAKMERLQAEYIELEKAYNELLTD